MGSGWGGDGKGEEKSVVSSLIFPLLSCQVSENPLKTQLLCSPVEWKIAAG
jgi:hypothetical protein